MSLFDSFERIDGSPATFEEDSFAFLNRARGPVWERIRDVLDQWFADYPPGHAADIRARFRSRRPGQHPSAWWELYLHRLFSRLGYELTPHPEVTSTTRRPDFEMTRGEARLYLEAAVVFSGVVDEERDGVREGWIMDALNRGTNRNFYVGIEFEQLGVQRPKDQHVYRPIEEWLATLDPDEATVVYERTGALPEKLFSVREWRFRCRAYPVKPDARSDSAAGRLLGHGPITGGFLDDREQLVDTLKQKRGKYGELDAPLVVAVNCASSFMEDDDIASALYGRSVAYLNTLGVAESAAPPNRLRDGIWTNDAGHRMAAVVSAVQLHPWTVTSTAPRLWLNLWAQRRLDADWPFTTWRCSTRGEIEVDEREIDMAALLGVPPGWPGTDRFGSVGANP